MGESKNILISPLNWGLGHASRIIPIIDYCLNSGKTIILGGNGDAISLLKKKYPELKCVYIPAPAMHYGKKRAMGISFYFRIFLMIANLIRERFITARIIQKYDIDTIISDNRPGIYSRKVKSIYITHQVNIFCSPNGGFFSKLYTNIHKRIISKYNFCWVPDLDQENNISGKLSKNDYKPSLHYVGPLSRFSTIKSITCKNTKFNIVCIVSGPEPQREIFEQILIRKFKNSTNKTLIIRGLPDSKEKLKSIGNLSFENHCNDADFLHYLNTAEIIVCRSGYSSVLDLIITGNNAILVSTPGQPEQEYLAKYLNRKHGFNSIEQSEICDYNFENLHRQRSSKQIYKDDTLKNILDLQL